MTNDRDMKLIQAALEAAASEAGYFGTIRDPRDGSYAGSNPVMGPDVADAIRAIDPAEILAKVGDAWQPIETAPTDRIRVLLFVPPYGVTTGHFEDNWENPKWVCHSVLNRAAIPTHWMPLPKEPKDHSHD